MSKRNEADGCWRDAVPARWDLRSVTRKGTKTQLPGD